MNSDETIAYEFLNHMFGGAVEYEPDGNVPPDFLVEQTHAVEVRRLNQHFFGSNEARGLEDLSYGIWSAFTETLEALNCKYHDHGSSFWVFLDYQRPLDISINQLKSRMRHALESCVDCRSVGESIITVTDNVELTIFPSQPIPNRLFRAAGNSDGDAGGWLVQIYQENIQYCIANKSAKVTPHKNRYTEWWLCLVDHIGWGLSEEESKTLADQITDFGHFDRIQIINRGSQPLLLLRDGL